MHNFRAEWASKVWQSEQLGDHVVVQSNGTPEDHDTGTASGSIASTIVEFFVLM